MAVQTNRNAHQTRQQSGKRAVTLSYSTHTETPMDSKNICQKPAAM